MAVAYKFKSKQCNKQDVDPFTKALHNKKLALKKVDFEQSEGTISALIAESSSGKTTTLSFLAGEVEPINIKSAMKKNRKA